MILKTDKDTVKNLVFEILSKEYPLKIIELTNIIRKRYGRSVTFQAVRKALIDHCEEGTLKKQGTGFSINHEWVLLQKERYASLYDDLTKQHKQPTKAEGVTDEVTVLEFDTINKAMKFWQVLVDDWFRNFKKGEPNLNCYEGTHVWEGLLHAHTEQEIMGQLKKKGIKSYAIIKSNTKLDMSTKNFYNKIGIKTLLNPTQSPTERQQYVATYGATVLQVTFPRKIAEKLDNFFKKNKSIEMLNIQELSEIANMEGKVKMTVIKNLEMAKHINQSIISQIE